MTRHSQCQLLRLTHLSRVSGVWQAIWSQTQQRKFSVLSTTLISWWLFFTGLNLYQQYQLQLNWYWLESAKLQHLQMRSTSKLELQHSGKMAEQPPFTPKIALLTTFYIKDWNCWQEKHFPEDSMCLKFILTQILPSVQQRHKGLHHLQKCTDLWNINSHGAQPKHIRQVI